MCTSLTKCYTLHTIHCKPKHHINIITAHGTLRTTHNTIYLSLSLYIYIYIIYHATYNLHNVSLSHRCHQPHDPDSHFEILDHHPCQTLQPCSGFQQRVNFDLILCELLPSWLRKHENGMYYGCSLRPHAVPKPSLNPAFTSIVHSSLSPPLPKATQVIADSPGLPLLAPSKHTKSQGHF